MTLVTNPETGRGGRGDTDEAVEFKRAVAAIVTSTVKASITFTKTESIAAGPTSTQTEVAYAKTTIFTTAVPETVCDNPAVRTFTVLSQPPATTEIKALYLTIYTQATVAYW